MYTRIPIGGAVLRPAQYHMEMSISNISRDKSFVDDLNKEQGIVSMRVGSALRSTEIKPLFPDLWRKSCWNSLFSTPFSPAQINPPPSDYVQAMFCVCCFIYSIKAMCVINSVNFFFSLIQS